MTAIKHKPTSFVPGDRRGMLEVIRRATPEEAGRHSCAWWLCRCDCGKERIVSTQLLKRTSVPSCGCINREIHARNAAKAVQARAEKRKAEGKKKKSAWYGAGITQACRCKGCGKSFEIYSGQKWAYRDGRGLYCTWSCMRADEKRKAERGHAL